MKASSSHRNPIEDKLLAEICEDCGAAAGSIIRTDRSGRNRSEHEGLLFEHVAKWLEKGAQPPSSFWTRLGDEFYKKSGDGQWGVTGDALLGRSIVSVVDIRPEGTRWRGELHSEDGAKKQVEIKPDYCKVIPELIGSELQEMLVAPIHCYNLVVGAIKLFNHRNCRTCEPQKGSFEAHREKILEATGKIANYWAQTHPIRCEVVALFIDVTDSTSLLVASGYFDGARIFQKFAEALQKEIDAIGKDLSSRAKASRAALYGGTPFLDKFTGDGFLVLVPYDRAYLFEDEFIEPHYVGPNVGRLVEAAHIAWQDILTGAECRRALREAGMVKQPLRIAISSGPAYLGQFGPQISAIGRPLIEASRILDAKMYPSPSDNAGEPLILASKSFVEDFGIRVQDHAGERIALRGLPGKRRVFPIKLEEFPRGLKPKA